MKINLLMKKEEIDHEKIDQTKIAIVLDILLATTTITAALSEGAECVIPVLDDQEARAEGKKHDEKDICLTGEYAGMVIDGFNNPAPSLLLDHVRGKKVILSTTNGTVAIRNVADAKKTYIASLLNGQAVAEEIVKQYNGETILVVCSGSSGQFCLEDYYGAGYLINKLIQLYGEGKIDLTDSARSAALFYERFSEDSERILGESKVGQMLNHFGLEADVKYASQKGKINLIPRLIGKKVVS